MNITTLFLVVLAAIVAWWLSQRRITAKSWLEAGPIGDTGASPLPAAKIGLGVFAPSSHLSISHPSRRLPVALLFRQTDSVALSRFDSPIGFPMLQHLWSEFLPEAVLGPGANTAHANHYHLDLGVHGTSGNYRICE
jgi:Extensin-like protein C-terminus